MDTVGNPVQAGAPISQLSGALSPPLVVRTSAELSTSYLPRGYVPLFLRAAHSQR